MFLLKAATSLCIFELCAGGDHWSYHDESKWPALCRTGRRQSPINIDTARVVPAPAAPLQYRGYSHVQLRAVNNGHTVQFSVEGEDADRPSLTGGPLQGPYVLDQLHFHWLGEHAVDHVKYPLEIHLVHRRRDVAREQARSQDNGLAVVAVLCKLTTDESQDSALKDLVQVVMQVVNSSAEVAAGKLDLMPVLGPQPNSYYTYRGSLTTPGCLESVIWLILDTPIRFTDLQYRKFSAVQVGGIANFRRLQPLNSRVVFRPAPSAAVATRPGVVGGLAVAVAGLLAATSATAAIMATLVQIAVDATLKVKQHVFGVNITVGRGV